MQFQFAWCVGDNESMAMELAPATSYYSSTASPEKGRFVHAELKIKPKEKEGRKEGRYMGP